MDKQTIVTTQQLADRLGISDRHTRRLRDAGVLLECGRNKYLLEKSLERFLGHQASINHKKPSKKIKAVEKKEKDDVFQETPQKNMISIDEIKLSGTELSDLLDISRNELSKLREEGIFARDLNRNFLLVASVRSYIANLRGQKQKKDPDHELKLLDIKIKELKLRKAQRDLVEKQNVFQEIDMAISIFKQNLAKVPDVLASKVYKQDINSIHSAISKEIHDALSLMSQSLLESSKKIKKGGTDE